MQLHFLGTGDAFCSGGRFQTCFLVEVEDFRFLIDCGATSLLALKSQDISTDQLDGVIISHFHGDHFGGLPYILLDANFTKARTQPFHILGPPGVANRVEELMDICYPKVDIHSLNFKVLFQEYKPDHKQSFGPLRVEALPVIHVPASKPHGLRIHHGNSILAFSGDTGWTDNLYGIADGASLFICECNFYQTEMPSHLNYLKIDSEQSNFNCDRIILNHLGVEMLANLHQVKLPCSEDGMIIEV